MSNDSLTSTAWIHANQVLISNSFPADLRLPSGVSGSRVARGCDFCLGNIEKERLSIHDSVACDSGKEKGDRKKSVNPFARTDVADGETIKTFSRRNEYRSLTYCM